MKMKSLNIPGLTDIQDATAESLSGGRFTVNFITEDGEKITNRVDNLDSGLLNVPDNIERIRVRNLGDEASNFNIGFSSRSESVSPTGSSSSIFERGTSFSIGSKSGSTVFNADDAFMSRNVNGGEVSYTPDTIRVSTSTV